MNTRIIALSVATVLSAQSIAFAQAPDRTIGVGAKSIAEAQANLKSLQGDLVKLDQALAQIAQSIETRDKKGSIANAAAVTGTAIGLGASVISFLNVSTGQESFMALGMLVGMFATVTTFAAGTAGGVSVLQKTSVPVEQMSITIAQIQTQVGTDLANAKDNSAKNVLSELKKSLAGLQTSLVAYTQDDSSSTRNRLLTHFAQVAGTAITVYGFSPKGLDTPYILAVGTLLMSAGNIGRMIEAMSDSQVEQVLGEIAKTRATVRDAVLALR